MSKVKPILYVLGKGGISVLQTAIFENMCRIYMKIQYPEMCTNFKPSILDICTVELPKLECRKLECSTKLGVNLV